MKLKSLHRSSNKQGQLVENPVDPTARPQQTPKQALAAKLQKAIDTGMISNEEGYWRAQELGCYNEFLAIDTGKIDLVDQDDPRYKPPGSVPEWDILGPVDHGHDDGDVEMVEPEL